MSNLTRLEAQVNKVATNMENRLSRAFKTNGAQQLGDTFAAIQKNATRTANHIQREMQRGFSVGGLGGGMFNRYESEGLRAANRVETAMRNAAQAGRPSRGDSHRPYTPRARQGLTGADAIHDLVQRQQTSAFFGQMQLRTPETAQAYTARLNALRDQHISSGAGDINTFRQNLRTLNFEYAQQARAASMARQAARQQAGEGVSVLGRLGGAAAAAAAAFVTVQKSVEMFNDALIEGNKRAQARTMLSSAYGADSTVITAAVNDYSNRYGADKATAQQQAAQLRFTLPEKQFSNQDIPKLLETESIFAHQTGMTADSVERFNYALSQIAASAKLMGQDWLQVVNASPALIKPLERLTGTSDTRQLREKLKALTGAEVSKLMIQAMENLNASTGAAAKAMDSMQATQGRLRNASNDALEQFYNGFSSGFKKLLNALTGFILNHQGIFLSLGKGLGKFFEMLAVWTYKLDDLASTAEAYIADFKDMWDKFYKWLPKPVQDTLGTIADVFEKWAKAMLVTAALFGTGAAAKTGGSWIMRMLGLGGGAAALAEGGAVAAATPVMPIAGASLLTYFGLKAAGYEPGYVQKNEEGIPGAPAKNSRLNQFLDWAGANLSSVAGNYTGMSALPSLSSQQAPAIPQTQKIELSMSQVQFAPLTLNIPMPDGSTYTTQAEVKNLMGDHMESILMTSQGLGGGWQVAGQNAGFSPSLLKR
ncbi:TPA: tape measure protein [Enterobacter asburiae]|nr:tape measure protein [Enterobacter asburiae]